MKVIGCVCCMICGSRFDLKSRGKRTCSEKCRHKLYKMENREKYLTSVKKNTAKIS